MFTYHKGADRMGKKLDITFWLFPSYFIEVHKISISRL